MSDHEAVAAAGEAAVGDEGDLVTKAPSHDGARRGQHLAHAGAPARPLVADHNDVTSAHAAGEDRLGGAFLALEYPRPALEALALLAGDLGHRALGCQVPVQHHEVAVLLQGVREWPDNLLPA